jgi:hypothetical protein
MSAVQYGLVGGFGMEKGIYLGLDLNEEPMEVNGVDDQPTPIVKLPQACEYAQLLSKFVMKHPLKFLLVDVMNMQSFMDTQRECRIII